MDWHSRYLQQARWTQQLRAYLFGRIGLADAKRVLEVGCGTGAVLADFPLNKGVYGLDINLRSLGDAAQYAPNSSFTCGDGLLLPFGDDEFDVVFCHFLLLWCESPDRIVAEMRRVTHNGGSVLALAEPDYGARIDYPNGLSELGNWQVQSLRDQGADPGMGRKLAGIFSRSGLKHVEAGILGGEWRRENTAGQSELEWQVLMDDLSGRVPFQKIQEMKAQDEKAWEMGERVLYVPTFYAWGLV